jgi:hypothetical protein
MALPLFEIKISGSPIAFVKGGDKQINFIKIKKFSGKYFCTKDGAIYELDDQYEYRYKSTSIYIYNFANSKPLSLIGMQEVDQTLRKEGYVSLPNIRRLQEILQQQKIDPNSIKMPPDIVETMTAETKRFVQAYSLDDEYAKTDIMVKIHHQKRPIIRWSSPLIGMGFNRGNFAFIQYAHKKLDCTQMVIHNNRAYTKYGTFHYYIDNMYLSKKQIICFYILSDEKETPVLPYPKKTWKLMIRLMRKKQWDKLDLFTPGYTKEKLDKIMVNFPKPVKKSRFSKHKPVDDTTQSTPQNIGEYDIVQEEPKKPKEKKPKHKFNLFKKSNKPKPDQPDMDDKVTAEEALDMIDGESEKTVEHNPIDTFVEVDASNVLPPSTEALLYQANMESRLDSEPEMDLDSVEQSVESTNEITPPELSIEIKSDEEIVSNKPRKRYTTTKSILDRLSMKNRGKKDVQE